MSSKLTLLTALIVISHMASTESQSPSSSSSKGLFAADLFGQISKERIAENVILSPVSIQTALAMTYLGAEGETASELVKGLRLPTSDKDQVGRIFAEVLKEKKGEAQLSIANRLFVNSGLKLQSTFNERARKYFNSEAENVNFSQSPEAIKTINSWVEKETNNKITNLLQPGSVNGDTSAIIVNAIYFKGKWQSPFSKTATTNGTFWVSKTKSVQVDLMHSLDDEFKYAAFPELDATAIEMPYKDSDISMMLILPNERDGLAKLEEKLSSVSVNDLASKLSNNDVNVIVPKFKIEFTIELTDVLRKLGIQSLFGDKADLTGIFESGGRISNVQHKAFIDVNEAGSEAAAASFLKIVPFSLNLNQKNFIVDHPFVFAIRSPEEVYFIGHVANL